MTFPLVTEPRTATTGSMQVAVKRKEAGIAEAGAGDEETLDLWAPSPPPHVSEDAGED